MMIHRDYSADSEVDHERAASAIVSKVIKRDDYGFVAFELRGARTGNNQDTYYWSLWPKHDEGE